MQENRIRIVDIAERLGLSTATVSNVIHGKTSKMSPRTAQRVWQELETVGYIPDMAGVWLAQKSSRIIGVVVDDSPKYEGKVLEDGFVTASLNALSRETNEKGFFLMVKTTRTLDEVPAFASMWRMEGLILMGFCEADYAALRRAIRTPIVVYDGYMQGCPGVVSRDRPRRRRAAGWAIPESRRPHPGALSGRQQYLHGQGANGRLCGGLWPRPRDPLAGPGAGPAPAAVL